MYAVTNAGPRTCTLSVFCVCEVSVIEHDTRDKDLSDLLLFVMSINTLPNDGNSNKDTKYSNA